MKRSNVESIKKLLATEDTQLGRLHKIVEDTLTEEKLISRRLRREFRVKPDLAGRIADRVASFGGSWKFIILFFLFIGGWIVINGYLLSGDQAIDPYPFILLNLVLSCLAAVQAPIILMSQNRLEAMDRRRAEHDYVINLKAELEIRALHQKLDVLMLEQMKVLIETQERQIRELDHLKKTK